MTHTILTSGVTDGRVGGRAAPSGKLNVKTGPLLIDILIFRIILVFSRLLFFAFFRMLLFLLASIDIHDIRIH